MKTPGAITSIQHYTRDPGRQHKAKRIKIRYKIGKVEIKLSLFVDHIILHIKYSKNVEMDN